MCDSVCVQCRSQLEGEGQKSERQEISYTWGFRRKKAARGTSNSSSMSVHRGRELKNFGQMSVFNKSLPVYHQQVNVNIF